MDEKEINKVFAVAERPDDMADFKYAESEDRTARIVPMQVDRQGIEPMDDKTKIAIIGGATGGNRIMLAHLASRAINLFQDEQGREVIPIIEDMHASHIRTPNHVVGERVVNSSAQMYLCDKVTSDKVRAKRKAQKKARKASRRK